MKITFIQTGGTIDKDYPRTTKGWAFEIDAPAVERVLEKLHPSFEYEVLSMLKKDSMEITHEDRQALFEACEQVTNNKIIITHGTDTMIDTAKHLAGIAHKTIVITGAMKPERFSNSDAPINIGTAIGAVQSLPPGVYLAMHGTVKRFDEIQRNLNTGQYH